MMTSTQAPHGRFPGLVCAALLLAAGSASAGATTPGEGTAASSCAAPLVVLAPDAVAGDGTAVAVTAQSLEADRAGWAHVGWEAADDVELDGVVATTVDGSARSLPSTPTGHAEGVQQLAFCGDRGRDAADEVGGTPVPDWGRAPRAHER